VHEHSCNPTARSFTKRLLDNFPVSLPYEVERIPVSQVHTAQLTHDLVIHQAQAVFYGLIKNHMKELKAVNAMFLQALNRMHVYSLQEVVNLFNLVCFIKFVLDARFVTSEIVHFFPFVHFFVIKLC